MPYAVFHILIPLLIISLIRDYIISKKGKKSFPLHYVLIAGLAGAFPDFDIALYWGLHFFGFIFNSVHRTYAHSVFLPLLFLMLFFVFRNIKLQTLGKHKLKLSIIFLMISFGTFTHVILDAFLSGPLTPFYPLLYMKIGFAPFDALPSPLAGLALPCIEAGLFILWLAYLELKHKISDFI